MHRRISVLDTCRRSVARLDGECGYRHLPRTLNSEAALIHNGYHSDCVAPVILSDGALGTIMPISVTTVVTIDEGASLIDCRSRSTLTLDSDQLTS